MIERLERERREREEQDRPRLEIEIQQPDGRPSSERPERSTSRVVTIQVW